MASAVVDDGSSSPPRDQGRQGEEEQPGPSTLLHKAAAAGNVEACRQLLQGDPACVDARDNFGRTALCVCVHLPTVAVLLASGADTTFCRQGIDLVTWHRSRGRADIADLIDLRRAPDHVAKLLARDAVDDAVQVGNSAIELAERWLPGTALADEIRVAGQTSQTLQQALAEAQRLFRDEEYTQAHAAYSHAASLAPSSRKIAERLENLEPLCRMQAKLRELETKQLSTPPRVANAALTPPRGQKTLSRTCSGRQIINVAAVHRLLDSGAPLNERDECGRTALIWSVENNLPDLVSLLLTRTEGERANPNTTDNKGRSALHLAQTPAVASMLIRAGSELQLKNADGRTPEAQHRRHGRFDVAELIAERGDILHLQGLAERRLMHGDTQAASDAYRDALELCARNADGSSSLAALQQSLVAGHKRASEIAEALASASTNAAEIFTNVQPLVLPLPSSGSRGMEESEQIFRRIGVLQAILNDRVPGRWTLKQCMGQGSSGMVVKATDTIRQEVAVKLVMPEQEGEEFGKADSRRLRREAQAIMRVQDPHVCAAFDSFFFPNEHHPLAFVLILEAVNGPTLAHQLNSVSQMTELDVACVCKDLLRGLKAVHAAGLVHRDLKPDNICTAGVQTEARRIHKLLDFGLARAVATDQCEQSGHMTDTLLAHTQDGNHQAGTPHYMSPEHWSLEWGTVNARADLWAVGVLAYQMLSGRLPFAHEKTDVLAVWSAVVGDSFVSTKMHNPGVSDAMDKWIEKALQKKQSDRFCSAAEMEEALQRALVADHLARYNIFISYRVKTEHKLALSMFSTISDAEVSVCGAQKQERLAVFLDKVRLLDGQRWDSQFIQALGCSDVFVPLVSIGALEPMTRLMDQVTPDNLLLEWMLALWMFKNGQIKSIVPLLLEHQAADSKAQDGDRSRKTLFDGLAQMAQDGRQLPDVVHEPTRVKAVDALHQLGLDAGMTMTASSKSFDEMTVTKVCEMIMMYQGCLMWDAPDQHCAIENATAKVVQVARSFVGNSGDSENNSQIKAPDAAGKPKKLGSILASSVMDVLQLRQELAQSQQQVSAQAHRISELSMEVSQLKLQKETAAVELATKQQHLARESYAGELTKQLQAENDKLQRRVAKWKDLATVRQSELKALRHEHVALAHQATETRQLAYAICTGHGRLNSNSSARLQIDAPAMKRTTLRRPSLKGGSTTAITPTPAPTVRHDLNAGLRAAVTVDPSPPLQKPSSKRMNKRTGKSKATLSSMLAQGVTTQAAHANTNALPMVRQRS
eukprot:COSAG02_NODE_1447_length_12575_cov_8.479400_5_plen_1271_part_00